MKMEIWVPQYRENQRILTNSFASSPIILVNINVQLSRPCYIEQSSYLPHSLLSILDHSTRKDRSQLIIIICNVHCHHARHNFDSTFLYDTCQANEYSTGISTYYIIIYNGNVHVISCMCKTEPKHLIQIREITSSLKRRMYQLDIERLPFNL